jgi:chaperonin GroES
MSSKKLEAVFSAIIVKPVENDETSYGGIIVPDLGNEKSKVGTVVSVGPGSYTVTGNWISTVLKVGDTVILPAMGFSKFDYEGEEYWMGNENQVLCKIS